MEANFFFGIIGSLILIVCVILVIVSLFIKNYYSVYQTLPDQEPVVVLKILYTTIFYNKIYKDGLSTRYKHIAITESELNKLFKVNKIISLEERFEVLNNFEEYIENDFKVSKMLKVVTEKKINKNLELYDNLKILYLANQTNYR